MTGKRFNILALLVIFVMLLAACGPQATPVQPAAQPTDTPAAPAAETPAGDGMGTFDPSTVAKIQVEEGATLRVSGWGNPSEQQVTRDMLDRFEAVYTNVN